MGKSEFDKDMDLVRKSLLIGMGVSEEVAESKFPTKTVPEAMEDLKEHVKTLPPEAQEGIKTAIAEDRARYTQAWADRNGMGCWGGESPTGRLPKALPVSKPSGGPLIFQPIAQSPQLKRLWQEVAEMEKVLLHNMEIPAELLGLAGAPQSLISKAHAPREHSFRFFTNKESEEVRQRFSTVGTQTGRLSCKEPNLSNPPRVDLRHVDAAVELGLRKTRIFLVDTLDLPLFAEPTDIRLRRTSIPLVRSLLSGKEGIEVVCLLESRTAGVLADILHAEFSTHEGGPQPFKDGDRVVLFKKNGKLFDTWLLDITTAPKTYRGLGAVS